MTVCLCVGHGKRSGSPQADTFGAMPKLTIRIMETRRERLALKTRKTP
jgi:hypothetical protein